MKFFDEEKNIAEALLHIELAKDPFSEKVKAAASLLAKVPILTEEVFERLKDENLIEKEIDFTDVKALLDKKDNFFTFPAVLDGYLSSLSISTQTSSKLDTVLLKYYTEKMQQSEEDIVQYLIFFDECISILLDEEYEHLSRWLLRPLYIFMGFHLGGCGTLKGPLRRSISQLNNEKEQSSPEGKLTLGAIFLILGKIHIDLSEDSYAMSSLNKCINIFNTIDEQVPGTMSKESTERWKKQYDEMFRSFQGVAHYERGALFFEKNQFRDALNNWTLAEKHLLYLNCIARQVMLWLYLGANLPAEMELLRLARHIKKDPSFETGYLYYLGKYYDSIGLPDEALRIKKVHLEHEIEKKSENNWKAVAMREFAISNIKKNIDANILDIAAFTPYIELLKSCISLCEHLDDEKYSAYAYLWLGRTYMHLKDLEEASASLQKGFETLTANYLPTRVEYYEFYLTYAKLLHAANKMEDEYPVRIQDLYKRIQKIFGAQIPLLKEIIPLLKATTDDVYQCEILDKHYALIETIPNPSVTVTDFKAVKGLPPAKDIIDQIRSKLLMLIPDGTKTAKIRAYKPPFLKTFLLLEVTMPTQHAPIKRYFLYNGLEEIYSLDGSNSSIYTVAEKDFCFSSAKDIALYIKFFTDVSEGKYGKFYILESVDDHIPWSFNISEEEKERQKAFLAKYIHPITFLFKEDKIEDNVSTTFWHFSGCILFKNDLFISRFEVNEKTGSMRMYDDNHVTEAKDTQLSIMVDIKALAI